MPIPNVDQNEDLRVMNVFVTPITLDYSEFQESHPDMTQDDMQEFIDKLTEPMRFFETNEDGITDICQEAPRRVITTFEVDGVDNLSAIIQGYYTVTAEVLSMWFREKALQVELTLSIYHTDSGVDREELHGVKGNASVTGIPVPLDDDDEDYEN